MFSKLVVTHKYLPLRYFLLLLSIPVSIAVASSYYPNTNITSNGKCQDKCGGVSIFFPFGMGRNCSLGEWYEIDCNNGTPWLKKLGLQVLIISYPLTPSTNPHVKVNYPIFYDNSSCSRTRSGSMEPVTFYGSPFVFSEGNTFVVLGCNNTAMIKGSTPSFTGCKTECSGNNTSSYSACDGNGCCQVMILSGLQGVSIDFPSVPGLSGVNQDCRFALLVDLIWLKTNLTDLVALRDQNYVPLWLDWGIIDEDFLAWIFAQQDYQDSTIIQCHRTVYGSKIMYCACPSGYQGNPYIQGGCQDIDECGDPLLNSCPGNCVNYRGGYNCVDGSRKIKLAMMVIGGFVGALVLLFSSRWLCKYIRRRKKMKLKQKFFKQNGGLLLQQQLGSPQGNVEKSKLFNSKELEKATDNFNENRILGKGGQGTVYKGMLIDGRIVAVKRSTVLDVGNVEQFINEVFILSQINHRNVVKLLGCCLETEVPLLVYEFISNGTLYQYLHEPDEEFPVPWNVRMRISSEVAGALSYLHSAASMPIYHRDIKTRNILLDEKYRAKIADFGTSRSVALDQTHVTTLVQGTFGYMDPEYFQSSQFTEKSDVYSFGVVLVELLTGQKPICSLRAQEGRSLATYFNISMKEDRLFNIVDHQVLNQANKEEILKVALLAERCLNLNGRKRPTMTEVAMELEAIRKPSQSSDAQHTEPMRGNFEIEGIEAHDVAFRSAVNEAGDGDGSSPTIDLYPLISSGTW